MPIYEYKCSNCGVEVEITQNITDQPLTLCEKCNTDTLVRLISSTAFHLKGSGWYKTDYATPKKEDGKKEKGEGSEKKKKKSEGGENKAKEKSTPEGGKKESV